MPEASVRRRRQTLSGFIGRKESAGAPLHLTLNPSAQRENWVRDEWGLDDREITGTLGVGVKSVDIERNTKGEGKLLAVYRRSVLES